MRLGRKLSASDDPSEFQKHGEVHTSNVPSPWSFVHLIALFAMHRERFEKLIIKMSKFLQVRTFPTQGWYIRVEALNQLQHIVRI